MGKLQGQTPAGIGGSQYPAVKGKSLGRFGKERQGNPGPVRQMDGFSQDRPGVFGQDIIRLGGNDLDRITVLAGGKDRRGIIGDLSGRRGSISASLGGVYGVSQGKEAGKSDLGILITLGISFNDPVGMPEMLIQKGGIFHDPEGIAYRIQPEYIFQKFCLIPVKPIVSGDPAQGKSVKFSRGYSPGISRSHNPGDPSSGKIDNHGGYDDKHDADAQYGRSQGIIFFKVAYIILKKVQV
jgi:hypothetical protein